MPINSVIRKKPVRPMAKKIETGAKPVLAATRQEFLGLSLERQREILAAQARTARGYYEQSTEWREWEAANLTTERDE